MNLQELKQKNPAELINEAEKLGIENPSTLRKQEILFAILKDLKEVKVLFFFIKEIALSIIFIFL